MATKGPALAEINHVISREEARELIGTYRKIKSRILNPELARSDKDHGILPVSEAFNDKAVMSLLSQPGCVGLRIQYGAKMIIDKRTKKEIPTVVAVLVGVDSKGNNIWGKPKASKLVKSSKAAMALRGEGEDAVILEDSHRCPPYSESNPTP